MKKILFSLFCLFLLVSTVDAADMTVAWKVGGMKGNPVQALLHIEIREPLRFVTPIMLPALETVFSKHTTLPIYEILKGVVENDPESIVITMNGETGLHPEIAKMAPDDMVTVFFHNPRKLKGQIPEEAFPVNILHAKKKKNFWLVTTPSAQLHVDSDISIHYRNGKGEDIFYGMVVAENGIQGVIHSSIPDVKFVSVGNSVIPWKKSTPNMLFVESVYDGKILGIFNKHITGQFSKFLKIHPFMNKNAGVGHFVIDDEAHSSYQFQFENPFNEAFSKKIEIFPLLDKIPGYRSLATPNLANGQGTKKGIIAVFSKNSIMMTFQEPLKATSFAGLKQKPATFVLEARLQELWSKFYFSPDFLNSFGIKSPFLNSIFQNRALSKETFPFTLLQVAKTPDEDVSRFILMWNPAKSEEMVRFWEKLLDTLSK